MIEDNEGTWSVGITLYGKNRARAVSTDLMNYLKQEGLSTCEGYNPYE